MKTPLLCLAMLMAAPVIAADKDSPARYVDGLAFQPLEQLGGAPSDLTPDASFSVDGLAIADFNNAGVYDDFARRVFPAAGGGYWVAGTHGSAGNFQIAIAKLTEGGNPDASYNGSGKLTLPASPLFSVADVAKSNTDSLYFLGGYFPSGFAQDFGVLCINATGARCPGFGVNGFQGFSFNLGDSGQDVPIRIVVHAGWLYLAGTCDTGSAGTPNYALCIGKINASTGQTELSFGTAGRYSRNLDLAVNGRDAILDLIAYSTPSAVRLVMVGEVRRNHPTDIDGFISSINGITGQNETLFGPSGYRTVFADLGSGKQDFLTRLLRRANGSFVAAGYAQDDSASPMQEQLLLAAFHANGSVDGRFGTGGQSHALVLSGENRPFGLAERPGNRDIVVGLNIRDDIFGDGHPLIGYVQYGRHGRQLHASTTVDPPSANVARRSVGADLIRDGERIVSAGFRRWSESINDFDMIVVRQIANDSLFASQFGGDASD